MEFANRWADTASQICINIAHTVDRAQRTAPLWDPGVRIQLLAVNTEYESYVSWQWPRWVWVTPSAAETFKTRSLKGRRVHHTPHALCLGALPPRTIPHCVHFQRIAGKIIRCWSSVKYHLLCREGKFVTVKCHLVVLHPPISYLRRR